MTPATSKPTPALDAVHQDGHVQVLDGWRGLSILLVLISHLAPLGANTVDYVVRPVNRWLQLDNAIDAETWRLNGAIGVMGMVLFFNLSGFLITSFLLRPGAAVPAFLVRRLLRIVPLAWLYLAIAFAFVQPDWQIWLANFLFYANLPPQQLVPHHDHFWSLCVEMQFYLGIALLFAVLGRRGLLLLPVIAVGFTLLRAHDAALASSITYHRIDEILAGCVLALALRDQLGRTGAWAMACMRAAPLWLLLLLWGLSSLPAMGWLNYLRPYIAALLIGASLLQAPGLVQRVLCTRFLGYLAAISYALYVFHLGLTATWLGSGDLMERYLKRPLLLAVAVGLAHVSTFYYERHWIELGRKWSERLRPSSRMPK